MKFDILLCAALACALSAQSGAASAETYPSRSIKIIVPFSPGGAPDILARAVGNRMAQRLGQSVVVENKVGASGQIGLTATAQSQPDGYTLGVGAVTNLAMAPHTNKRLPYDPLKSFAPVVLGTTNYLALVARTNAPFKTAPDMIRWAKENPGRLSIGTSGLGGLPHLAFESLARTTGFTFLNVPYPGDARVLTDLKSGILDASFITYTAAAPLVDAGELQLLGISTPARDPDLPALPTLAESLQGFETLGWFGFVAPAGTPADIVSKLNEEISLALKQPDLQKSLRTLGLTPATGSPDEFGELIRRENEKYQKLISAIQFQPQ